MSKKILSLAFGAAVIAMASGAHATTLDDEKRINTFFRLGSSRFTSFILCSFECCSSFLPLRFEFRCRISTTLLFLHS